MGRRASVCFILVVASAVVAPSAPLDAAPPASAAASNQALPFDEALRVLAQLQAIGRAFQRFEGTYFALEPHRAGENNAADPRKKLEQPPVPGEDKDVDDLLNDLRTPETPPAMQPTRLSWRVHLLPFLGPNEKALYEKFRRNEPWDSPHNRTLLGEMPSIYRFKDEPGSTTRFQTLRGPQMLFGAASPPKSLEVADGARNTILAVFAGPEKATPWTKPDDITFAPQNPLECLGLTVRDPIYAVSVEANWIVLPGKISPQELTGFCTPRGNEVVDAEVYQFQIESKFGDSLANLVRRKFGESPKYYSPLEAQAAAAERALIQQRVTKLRRIARGMADFHDTYARFPVMINPQHVGPSGKSQLSWRVHLLPFLDQTPLFNRFKLNEPWDSPANRPLLERMPEVFRDPEAARDDTTTRFATISHKDGVFHETQGLSMKAIVDGTDETLLLVQAGADKRIPWTKPDDLPFDANAPLACLGNLQAEPLYCAFVNGRVGIFKPAIPVDLFHALMTRNGGERIKGRLPEFEAK